MSGEMVVAVGRCRSTHCQYGFAIRLPRRGAGRCDTAYELFEGRLDVPLTAGLRMWRSEKAKKKDQWPVSDDY